ncbi:MAG: DUF58 domain-containing protein, partial [Halobacteriovoraceae bacterium]|nr:DUF58 domain-containing protein [Halobacteriovoraceae bacterium]
MRNWRKIILKNERIYILPTTLGFYFLAIIFVLFVISLSYAHSLAFTTTFIFVSIVMTSAIYTHYNLANVKLLALKGPEGCFEGEDYSLVLTLENIGRGIKFDLLAKLDGQVSFKGVSLESQSKNDIILSLVGLKRGSYKIERITLTTSFPFGIFFSWVHIPVTKNFFIYPARGQAQHLPLLDIAREGNWTRYVKGKDEFLEHKKFENTDSWADVDWKAYARGKGLWTKCYSANPNLGYQIIFEQINGENFEIKLQNTCESLLSSATGNKYFSLKLPHYQNEYANGPEHLAICLG